MKHLWLLFTFLAASSLQAMPLDRVIISSDANTTYLDFWPLVARAWTKVVGIKPTLALIAPTEVEIDETIGDVIRFDPIPGIPTSLQAQLIRLLLPSYFPDEVCLISDIDALPLQKEYFINSISDLNDDSFVIFRDGEYEGYYPNHYPLWYLAAKGKTFQKLFELSSVQSISSKIQEWHALGWGWETDERVLYQATQEKKDQMAICLLGHKVTRRIDRANWHYDPKLVKMHYYIDSHLLRPYKQYQREIDLLAQQIDVDVTPSSQTPRTKPKINEWQVLDSDGTVMPWFTKPFLDLLKTWDMKDWDILEYGSGYSTAWLAKHCKRLVSVENHPTWSKEIQEYLQQENISNVVYKIRSSEIDPQENSIPYIEAIEEEDQKYDCIIIDGDPVACRNLCTQKALGYIKPGGIIILDNSNQATCEIDSTPTFILLSTFEHHTFQQPGHPDWRTDYWVIPENKSRTKKMTTEQKNRRLPINTEYGTHVTPLITAIVNTTGPIMEMGCGDFSTPLLHSLCSKEKRFLLSTETDKDWMNLFTDLQRSWHQFQYIPISEWHYEQLGYPPVGLWDHVGKETHWGVVFVDHSPGERRVEDIKRLRHQADIIVVHDTQQPTYNFEPILSSFKYRYDYERYFTRTTLLSETIDVAKLFE